MTDINTYNTSSNMPSSRDTYSPFGGNIHESNTANHYSNTSFPGPSSYDPSSSGATSSHIQLPSLTKASNMYLPYQQQQQQQQTQPQPQQQQYQQLPYQQQSTYQQILQPQQPLYGAPVAHPYGSDPRFATAGGPATIFDDKSGMMVSLNGGANGGTTTGFGLVPGAGVSGLPLGAGGASSAGLANTGTGLGSLSQEKKKRPRRKHDEIERIYQCNWKGCTKGYGTLNHLNAHVATQSHGPKRKPEEFKEIRAKIRERKRKAQESLKKQNQRSEADAAASGNTNVYGSVNDFASHNISSSISANGSPISGASVASTTAAGTSYENPYGGSNYTNSYNPLKIYGQQQQPQQSYATNPPYNTSFGYQQPFATTTNNSHSDAYSAPGTAVTNGSTSSSGATSAQSGINNDASASSSPLHSYPYSEPSSLSYGYTSAPLPLSNHSDNTSSSPTFRH